MENKNLEKRKTEIWWNKDIKALWKKKVAFIRQSQPTKERNKHLALHLFNNYTKCLLN